MLILGKRKHSVPTILAILVIFASKSTSDESLQVKNDDAEKASPTPFTSKVEEEKSDEKDEAFSNSEKASDDAKPENGDHHETPNDKEENQYAKKEESDQTPQVVNSDSEQSNEKVEEAEEHSSAPQEEKTEEGKPEDADGSRKLAEETKKQNVKLDDNSRKISLSDVNSITYDEGHTKQTKRDTRTTEFLGLPRDASYFFDDLEPFINNNSAKDNSQDNARAVRAIPSRENKVQKSKLGSKKDEMDEEAGEDEEDDNEKVEEEEEKNNSEGDYDDDEDSEPDCPPTEDSCTTSAECTTPTTECSPTTTQQCTTQQCTTRTTACTQRKTTTKCTTKFTCSTKCPTTEECTKCPRICVKANRKSIGYPPTTLKAAEWDDLETKNPHSTEQKPQSGQGSLSKKKFRSKSNPGKLRE